MGKLIGVGVWLMVTITGAGRAWAEPLSSLSLDDVRWQTLAAMTEAAAGTVGGRSGPTGGRVDGSETRNTAERSLRKGGDTRRYRYSTQRCRPSTASGVELTRRAGSGAR